MTANFGIVISTSGNSEQCGLRFFINFFMKNLISWNEIVDQFLRLGRTLEVHLELYPFILYQRS